MLNYRKQKKVKDLRHQLDTLSVEEGKKPCEFGQEIRNIKNQLEVVDVKKYKGAVGL